MRLLWIVCSIVKYFTSQNLILWYSGKVRLRFLNIKSQTLKENQMPAKSYNELIIQYSNDEGFLHYANEIEGATLDQNLFRKAAFEGFESGDLQIFRFRSQPTAAAHGVSLFSFRPLAAPLAGLRLLRRRLPRRPWPQLFIVSLFLSFLFTF